MIRRLLATLAILALLCVPALLTLPTAHAAVVGTYASALPAQSQSALGPVNPVSSSTYAGTWTAYVDLTCNPGPSNNFCVNGYEPPSWTNFEAAYTFHCNATGSACGYTATLHVTASTPGLAAACDPDFFDTLTGDCTEYLIGTAAIQPGFTGYPDFALLTGTGYVVGSGLPSGGVPLVNDGDEFPFDTGVIARPGTYAIRQFIPSLGSGVSGTETVQHLTYWQ